LFQQALHAVARERTLLILDGIEPLQYPPGPMGGQLRAPGVQSLLKQLARTANDTEHRGLCLVTTREPPTDRADVERRPAAAWGSVLRVDLGNLTEEAGAALLHHAGAKRAGAAEIKPDDAELLAASREVDGHALTLNLLGRFLARAHGGDIRRRDLVKMVKSEAEQAKIAIRNVRRDAMHEVKELLKKKLISTDDEKRAEAEVQKLTDQHIAKIDEVAGAKEKETMSL
jgi:hypothetical protein